MSQISYERFSASAENLWLPPLNGPGMPLPGPDFLAAAERLGETNTIKGKAKSAVLENYGPILEGLYAKVLLSRGEFQFLLNVKPGKQDVYPVIGGHLWGDSTSVPQPADVMILGHHPGEHEIRHGHAFCGPSSQLLLQTLNKLHVKGAANWYVTSAIKCVHPDGDDSWRDSWVKEFLLLLHLELRIVRPKYIWCLGSKALDSLLRPPWSKKRTLTSMEGIVVPFTYPCISRDGEIEEHTALVVASTHPGAVIRSPDVTDKFELGVSRFKQVLEKGSVGEDKETLDHRLITTKEGLDALVDEVLGDPTSYLDVPNTQLPTALIAVDAEWHGEHPQNENAYLRTIQISWSDRKAACIVLTNPGGEPLYKNWIRFCINKLKIILKNSPSRLVRIAMHFGIADLEWLVPYGLDLREEFQAANTPTEFRSIGGIDTGMAAHALQETGDMSLKSHALKYTSAPRYDIELISWKEAYCKEHGLKASDLEGFGECPIEILGPYGNYDADVTRRLAVFFLDKLHCDEFGNNCWRSFWTSQRILLPILEMHNTGLVLDKERVNILTEQYLKARGRLETEIKEWSRWPDLNLNSPFQIRELLYGEKYNGKINKEQPGVPIRLRPVGARTMGISPILTSDKRPIAWDELEAMGISEQEKTASTNKMTLAILSRDAAQVPAISKTGEQIFVDRRPQINLIRDYRYIGQVLKSILRAPVKDDSTEEFAQDEEGNYVFDGGLPSVVCADGKIRTHLYPTKETYRWSSSRPPLQNISKRREPDYKRILGKGYCYPLRSILKAPPGYVLVEADYIGAELYGMGMLSGDENLIQHCKRNQLPEDHPDFYDIHSHVAKLAFKLDCEPTKKGLESIGRAEIRIVAKSVIFGIAYGRGAKAIALAAREEGVDISVEDAQLIVDTIFEMYPGLLPFFAECRRRATNERWISGVGQQYRRAGVALDNKAKSDLERQFMNFPIQNLIAWTVDRAVDILYTSRSSKYAHLDYSLTLQIHDALLFTVRGDHAEAFIETVLPDCMIKNIPIYPTTLDGRRKKGVGPYYLGIDTDVFVNWGDVPMPEELLDIGCPPRLAHWKEIEYKKQQAWQHSKFTTINAQGKKEPKIRINGSWL